MNETDFCRADFDNRSAGFRRKAGDGDGMKVRSLESAADELCRMLAVPAMTFAIVIMRGWYQGRKRWPARIIEATLFAAVAKVLMPAATALYMQMWGVNAQSASDYAFMSCIIIGFIGIDTLSDAAKNYFGGK